MTTTSMNNPRSPPFHADWLVPDWPAPTHVRAVFSTRDGGVSAAPFDTLNLGDHVNDAPDAVRANRAVLREAIGATPVFLQQVHGQQVATLDRARTDEATTAADACVTTEPGLACTIMVADCLPVLFTDRQGVAVAAAHAGWRGLAGASGSGVLEAAVRAVNAAASSDVPTLLAWLGPCIGPKAFEVGDEVREAFVAQQAEASAWFSPCAPGKWLADLPGLARLRLRTLGFLDAQVYGNDSSCAWCTVNNPSRFFSYRRERVTGRMAACIWKL
ncbi:MAG: laccase [Rhodoferax sp.]|nr:laccase [Rhodoferax sp.]